MKRHSIILAALVGFTGLLFFSGCKKTDNPVGPPGSVSNAIVADVVAASLGGSASTHGLSAQMEEAAVVAGSGSFPKGSAGTDLRSFDTTIVREGTHGSFSYHYTFRYSIAFANVGNTLNFHYSMDGTFETPRLSSIDSASATMSVTHIIDADSLYTLNTTYLRTGDKETKGDSPVEFTSRITSTFSEVKISKDRKSVV